MAPPAPEPNDESVAKLKPPAVVVVEDIPDGPDITVGVPVKTPPDGNVSCKVTLLRGEPPPFK